MTASIKNCLHATRPKNLTKTQSLIVGMTQHLFQKYLEVFWRKKPKEMPVKIKRMAMTSTTLKEARQLCGTHIWTN